MSFKRFVLAATISVAAVGCGGPQDTKITVPTSAIEANVKKTLEQYEKAGKVGSSLTSLETDINAIKSSDSTKGEALLQDYRELVVADTPAKVKAKAKDMLGKL